TANTPLVVSLNTSTGKQIKGLEDNQGLKERMTEYAMTTKEIFQFDTVNGTLLYGYMIKPADFDESKQYPVLMYVYGGPGSQTVTNAWGGSRDFWHHHLAAEGYIVASIDNRGTGAR